MAKYWIDYKCGHSFEEQLYGKHDDRYAHIEHQRERLCSECYRAQETQRATEQARESGLPALRGSEKQVAWAETIRARKLADIADERAKFAALGARQSAPAEKIEAELSKFDAIVAVVAARTEARFWIDHREDGPVALLRGTR